MSFAQVSAAFNHLFRVVGNLFDFDSKGSEKRIRNLAIAVGAIGALFLLYVGYRWYITSREQGAQKEFSAQVAQFAKAKTPARLERSLEDLKAAHDQYSSSYVAPYFTAYEVDALIEQGKRNEALAALDAAISSLSSSNPLINLYKTKRALLKFDIDDQAVRDSGLRELQELANDNHNTQRDVAQFYLGLHYFVADNLDEAKKVWGDLIEQSASAASASPWADQARHKLALIV